MGIEALATGEINVYRHDAPQLREIKEGSWTKEQVEQEANRLRQDLDIAIIHSTLPSQANHKKAEILLMEILEDHFDCKERIEA